jgi:fatty-acyl-CoA synthase
MEIRHEIPTLEVILALLGKTDRDNRIFGLDEKLAEYPGDRLTFSRKIAPDDIASLYHTGGTTGRPKLAQRSHYNELSNAYQMGLLSGFTPDNKVMCGLPLFHVNGTIVTGLAPFWQGAQVVLLSPQGYRDPGIIKNFYRIIEKFKGTFFSSVPTILSVLLDVPKGDADISSLRYAICGAAPLSVELFKNFEAYTGLKVLEGYGLTESAAGASVNPKDGERRVGSIGLRFPYEEMKVAVLDDDGHYVRDANAGEIGVIVLRGPNIFKGYVDEAHNRGVWIDGGWFNTGDLGRTDPDGYFWLTGRRKELIIRGGHNLDPSSIEGPLYKMGKIRTAAAVGKPDAHAGEVPVVYVEMKDAETATPEEIIAFLRQHITERAALPKEVYILDKLPLTPIGKVFKPALAWDATRRAYEEALQGLGDLATSVQVTVGEDAVSGKLAKIAVTAAPGADRQVIRDLIRGKLARYTVKFEITVT